ncbi:MAG: thiamine pyrophosphokinase [Candidatus Ordinivivax streblomastigis]|uniref:Thiamine diphosphokinase n=1 Tax=Candidatus Ordinivivax streblomastigis TaxID=2540710 RepID=A0A5M8NZG4_9BACT|nr:MAG: thiamine pyrophosphokinase [Candidatus Ordinivivax streblomastigis]
MIPLIQNFKTFVLADGDFPCHAIPCAFLKNADRIICCDGATEKLLHFGMNPDYIVGDLDSISNELKTRFSPILFPYPDQETNDLTKSIHFCIEHGWTEITILGATGKREDHTMGNLALLTDYAESTQVQLLTDYGVFVPQLKSSVYESYAGQQVSIFSLTASTLFTTRNLVYPIENRVLTSWWQGTLNESLAGCFTVETTGGKSLVFREYQKY